MDDTIPQINIDTANKIEINRGLRLEDYIPLRGDDLVLVGRVIVSRPLDH